MKTSVGVWDELFGKRITLEIPLPNGGIKKVEVTKKWFDKMEHEGKVKPVSSPKVKVNILDPETKELDALTTHDDGKPSTYLIQRRLWEQARDDIKNMGEKSEQ